MFDRREILRAVALIGACSTLSLPARGANVYPLKLTRGHRPMIAVQVNGHPVEALLDSAAEASFVDHEVARRIGLTGSETVTAKGSGEKNFQVGLAKGVTLVAAGVTLRDKTVAISDLSDVGQRLLGHRLDMILGRELFDAAALRIDIRRRELEVLDDTSERRGVRYALKTVNGIEVFPVRVEGQETQAAFDLGNGSNLLISGKYARRRGLLTDGRPISRTKGGGLGGETEHQVIALKSIEVAGRTFTDVPASVDESDSATDLNVGMSVLRHFVMTVDFPARALWLAASP